VQMPYLLVSALGSVSIALIFVGSLYVWKSSRDAKTRADRDSPDGKSLYGALAISLIF
jgi:hypothetical protein